MAITVPTPVTAGPPVPDSSDPTTTFDVMFEAFNLWLKNQAQPEISALGASAYANALEANASAASAALAQYNAELSAANAASSAGAAMWVTGTYALGAATWSPANRLVYRKITASSSTSTDPSADATNWALVGVIPQPPAPAGSNIFLATTFGAL